MFRVLSSGLTISRGVEEVSERVGTLGPAGTLVHIASVQVGAGVRGLADSQSCAPWGGGRWRACTGEGAHSLRARWLAGAGRRSHASLP